MNNLSKIKKNSLTFGCAAVMAMFLGGLQAEANINQMNMYKKVFTGSKPKCLFCHLDTVPKKEDGKHDFNAYGLKLKETDEVPTEETYQKVGTVEEFEKKSQDVTGESAEPASEEVTEKK